MLFVQAWDNQNTAPADMPEIGLRWGRHLMYLWRDWEPRAGAYDYARVERELNARARPCYLQIGFSMYDKAARGPVDYTPAQHKDALRLTSAAGVTGEIPSYSAAWVDALCAATRAMAEKFKGHPNLAGFWPALGWDHESQAATDNAGGAWAGLTKAALEEGRYMDFLFRYGRACRDMWEPVPVYLPAAPSPGAVWAHRRRDVIATLLEEGCGYMDCGLLPDHQNAFGVGEYVGTAMTDIVVGKPGPLGFEEGARRAYDNSGELYWMALRALNWDADFLCVYDTLSSGPQAPAVAAKLPRTKRWLVWRDREGAAVTWTSGGKLYGTTFEPGCWGAGLEWEPSAEVDEPAPSARLSFDPCRFDAGRWVLDAPEGVRLRAPGLADGLYEATVHYPSNEVGARRVEVRDARFVLPPGSYHRVDLGERVAEPQLLGEVLQASAEAHDVLPIFEGAALAQAGFKQGLWPTSDEFEVVYAGVTYVAQRFRVPASREVRVLYCVKGRFHEVMRLSYWR